MRLICWCCACACRQALGFAALLGATPAARPISAEPLSVSPPLLDLLLACLQANSEVSALLGRIPSAVGYQPTLATDLGLLQERITTTKKGSITSVQVVRGVPAVVLPSCCCLAAKD